MRRTFARPTCPLAWPVIVLFDNDEGAKGLLGYARNNGHPEIALASTEPFYYMGYNLYLVKTPEIGPAKSCIEDLFPPDLLKTVVGGKTFEAGKTPLAAAS